LSLCVSCVLGLTSPFVKSSFVALDNGYDDVVFTVQPSSPKCFSNFQVIHVEVTSYLPGTATVDTAINGVFYLRWSDLPGVDVGSAYIVNNDNPSQTTLSTKTATNPGYITSNAVAGVAQFNFYVVGGDDTHTYQVMSSDMADPKACHEGYSCTFKICGGGAFGDPQFMGLQGQSFQVHGRPDTLFSLISYKQKGFALNSEFVYLADGKCDFNNTVCWSHPGTYFGKVGILLENSVRVLINSGTHKQGLTVYVDDKRSQPSDNAITTGSSLIHVVDYDRVEIRTADFFITLVNSDMFLNMDVSLLDKELLQQGRIKSANVKDAPEGLLGQTWQLKDYTSATGVKRPYKGTTDDYIVDTPFQFMH